MLLCCCAPSSSAHLSWNLSWPTHVTNLKAEIYIYIYIYFTTFFVRPLKLADAGSIPVCVCLVSSRKTHHVGDFLWCSFLYQEVQYEVRKRWHTRQVLEVLWNMLRTVQVCALWNLWEQASVPLLQGQEELQGQAQVSLNDNLLHSQDVPVLRN